MAKFLSCPSCCRCISRLGTEARLYRAMFLEEIGKDYVRTARAKGLSETVVLFRHVLRNALLPIVTSAGSYLPYVFLGSLVFESFFGLPGLGAYVIDAITKQDFAVVRTMVFVGSLLYIATFVLIDVAYTASAAVQHWVYNSKPAILIRDHGRYLRLDVAERRRAQAAWNQPGLVADGRAHAGARGPAAAGRDAASGGASA